MFGLIGKMTLAPGRRAGVAQVLAEATGAMPGNIAYVIAEDESDENVLWITEVWEDAAAHQASLHLPQVQAAITVARPDIVGLEQLAKTRVLG